MADTIWPVDKFIDGPPDTYQDMLRVQITKMRPKLAKDVEIRPEGNRKMYRLYYKGKTLSEDIPFYNEGRYLIHMANVRNRDDHDVE